MQVDFRNLKICFLAGTLGQGGAERQLYYILKSLCQLGNAPTVLSLTKEEYWEERILDLGVPVVWVGQSHSRLDRLRRVIMCLKNIKPDIIQSQHFYTNLYVAVAGRLLGVRHIGAMRNDGVSEVRDVGRLLGAISLRFPMFIAANSRRASTSAKSMGANDSRIFFLPNVVDTAAFQPSNREYKGKVRLLAVGRLVAQKRMDRFISIVARLQSRVGIPVSAIIVGTGPLEAALKAQARGLLSDEDAIEFCGAVSDMKSVYNQADIFVLTSDWEGTPNVVLEAMASGLPVVATNVGGVSDIVVHDKTGFLVEPKEDSELLSYLEKLATDASLRRRFGDAGRGFVEMNHSLESLPRHLDRLYSNILT